MPDMTLFWQVLLILAAGSLLLVALVEGAKKPRRPREIPSVFDSFPVARFDPLARDSWLAAMDLDWAIWKEARRKFPGARVLDLWRHLKGGGLVLYIHHKSGAMSFRVKEMA